MPMPTLITIRASHFCEKARWALERAGVGYREEAHPPLLHLLATVPRGGRSVPMLVTPHGVLKDSVAILRHADRLGPIEKRLYPQDSAPLAEVEAPAKRFDDDLGPAVRRVLYDYILGLPELENEVLPLASLAIERLAFKPLQPFVAKGMRRSLRIDDAGVARSRVKLAAVLDDTDALLADGRAFLLGDRFSAADLTLAALLGPAVYAPQYGCPLPPWHRLPAAARAEIEAIQQRPTGRFVLRMFQRERHA